MDLVITLCLGSLGMDPVITLCLRSLGMDPVYNAMFEIPRNGLC